VHLVVCMLVGLAVFLKPGRARMYLIETKDDSKGGPGNDIMAPKKLEDSAKILADALNALDYPLAPEYMVGNDDPGNAVNVNPGIITADETPKTIDDTALDGSEVPSVDSGSVYEYELGQDSDEVLDVLDKAEVDDADVAGDDSAEAVDTALPDSMELMKSIKIKSAADSAANPADDDDDDDTEETMAAAADNTVNENMVDEDIDEVYESYEYEDLDDSVALVDEKSKKARFG